MVLWLAKVLWSCSQPPPIPPLGDPPTASTPTATTGHTGTVAPCVDVDLGSSLPVALTSDTPATGDRQDASCAMPSRPDRVFRVVAREDRDHAIEVRPDGFDAVVWVAADCGGPLLACSDEPGLATERIVLGLGSDESVLVGVEAFEGPMGAFELAVDVVPPEACDNELDDDADGRIDCLDPECFTAERCARVCPDRQAPAGASVTVTGDTVGERDGWELGCLPYGGTSDVAIAFEPPADGAYVFDLVGSDFDTVLTLLAGCDGGQLACSDDAPGHAAPTSQVTAQLQAGVPVLAVVDGPGLSDVGAYTLNIAPLQTVESDCADGRDLDDDGAVDCADDDCAFDAACPEICDDQLDNDGDGDLDCVDAACTFDVDCPETCDDQLDNDGDGALDCLDARCEADAVCHPGCPEHVGATMGVVWSGSTVGRPDGQTPSCSSNSAASDVTVSYTAPKAGIVTFDTLGSDFDTVLTVLDGCGGAVLACNDDAGIGQIHSETQVSLSVGQQVVLVIDGFATASGATELNAR